VSTNTDDEIARANAAIAAITAAQPSIHGAFRRLGTAGPDNPFPLVTAGLHCIACEKNVGGATDFSGEVGPTDGEVSARSLLAVLADRGCPHADVLLTADERRSRG
jgi:hypothetical protein